MNGLRRGGEGSGDAAPKPVGICVLGIDGGRSGIGQYTRFLLAELASARPGWRVELVGQAADRDFFGELPATWTWHSVPSFVRGAAREILWVQFGMARLARRWDLCFFPAGNRRLAWKLPCPCVGTVHDFSSLHIAEKYDLWRRLYIFRILPALVRRLDRVIAISQASANDILHFADVEESRVEVIANGVHPRSPDPEGARSLVAESLGLEDPWLVYVSRLEHPGKNHISLVRAFEQRLEANPGSRHRLVLAGADWNGAEVVHEAIRQSPVADRILTPGFVDRSLLHALLDGADLMVFPSLYEGFGLPVLEAMAAGVPVASSDTSSLPEVGGDAACYFDPENPEAICRAMGFLLDSPQRRQIYIERGLGRVDQFSWPRCAELTARCLEDAMETR